ncbi:unnamed protein product [Onchocerca flexuosa]|uniref:BAR domain-containing protein n=1 Tax=Onchocerca flexuosa TaxID=387005 RepID=A0A183H4D4_9BILA|nr:unnamed protein product [Onchocerca flexuosa]
MLYENNVTRSITFCEQSKSDVTAIVKAVESMISNFKAVGMTPADSIANICSGLAVKTNNEKFNKVMKNVEKTLAEIAKTERSTVKQIETKFFECWSKKWLEQILIVYLDDINQLKKRRLDKDGLAQSANKYPDDETKQQKSKEADLHYEEQLMKVQQNIQEFPAHYKKTTEAIRELMHILADHFDRCENITADRLKYAKNG